MKELTFSLVKETPRQRFYKLSTPVDKVSNPYYQWNKEKEHNLKRLKKEYKPFHTDLIEYVCVSDAHTHIERLMFVAIPINESKTDFGCMAGLHIDGRHTMMIHGGSQRDVHPDEVYLRRLAKANGYKYGGLK